MKKNSKMTVHKVNEIIIEEGKTYSEMFKIISGSVAMYLNYGKENEYLIGVAGEHKCFGEVSLLSGKPSPYTVVANDNVMLMHISSDEFEGFIEHNANNAVDIMKNMAKNINMLSMNIQLIADEFSEILNKNDNEGVNKELTENLYKRILQYRMKAVSGISDFKIEI